MGGWTGELRTVLADQGGHRVSPVAPKLHHRWRLSDDVQFSWVENVLQTLDVPFHAIRLVGLVVAVRPKVAPGVHGEGLAGT